MTVLPCDAEHREAALTAAAEAVAGGELVVLPTDTVYGIGADAFDAGAVAALLAAKGRTRQMPPPVLVADLAMLDVLGTQVPPAARELAARFWPGALTLVVPAQPTLHWDLGETGGTVALRMPDQELTLALLRRTGPLAVSSANVTGQPAATSAAQAREQLGQAVSVYLDAGESPGGVPSTIVDARTGLLRIVRAGAITAQELGRVVPHLAPRGEPTSDGEAADDEAAASGGPGAHPDSGRGAQPDGRGAQPDGRGAQPDGRGAQSDGRGAQPDGGPA